MSKSEGIVDERTSKLEKKVDTSLHPHVENYQKFISYEVAGLSLFSWV